MNDAVAGGTRTSRSAGPYDRLRVDQVGSLVRPEPVARALRERAAGTLEDSEWTSLVASAVRDVVREQVDRRLLPVTDGEFWRENFQQSFPASVTGYAGGVTSFGRAAKKSAGKAGESSYARRLCVSERLAPATNHLLAEYLCASRDSDDVKVTIIGPERIRQRFDLEGSRDVYGSYEEFLDDVVAIERKMIAEVVDAGCRYIQIDEPSFTAYVDGSSLDAMRARGEDPAERLQAAIEANNAVVEGFDGVTFGIHLCRGNGPGGVWHREGAYDAIAEQLFGSLNFARLLLEYDSERAGTFTPLRFVAPGTVAVLGLVSTKVRELERSDDLLRRIEEASRSLDSDQLAISPQCGFASSGDRPDLAMSPDEQWAKLETVRDVAERAWGAVRAGGDDALV